MSNVNQDQSSKSTTTTKDTQTKNAPVAKTSAHLLAGGAAGLISAISLQPFDLLKTRLQQQQRSNVDYRTTIRKELMKLTKVKDLWRGALPSALRTSVGAGLYFTSLSACRTYLSNMKKTTQVSDTSALPQLSPFENLMTGFSMRALVGLITMPITVVKTRFESNMYNYNSMYEGVEGIYLDGQAKGSISNFFRGSLVTLARDCPYAGLYILFYESFKNDLFPKIVSSEFLHDDSWISRSALINTSAAVLAASVSTTITAPFDAIKTRLQLSPTHMSIVSATKSIILEKGGVSNLFRGLSLRFGRKGLSAGISWCIYEELIKAATIQNLLNKTSSTLK
ncbi:mitochondrial glycine transporter [[Candida] anglica]|uniref:Mitochondrial glycine transporter n=1 Tax=[Candida] anglica TaxID=148631 RepID=A0ABP0EN94_9ASCO